MEKMCIRDRYMVYRNMIDLEIPSVDQVVKVGDTMADIREGLSAKVHTVGIITAVSYTHLEPPGCNVVT